MDWGFYEFVIAELNIGLSVCEKKEVVGGNRRGHPPKILMS